MSPADSLLRGLRGSGGKMCRVSLGAYGGRVVVRVRYVYEKDGVLMPDQSGISFNADCIDDVIDALHALRVQMTKDGVRSHPQHGEPEFDFSKYPSDF